MKLWLAGAGGFLLLVGAGAVLLQTNQAPVDPPPVVEAPITTVAAATTKVFSTEEFRSLGAEVMGALPAKGSALPIFAAREGFTKIDEATKGDAALVEEGMTLYHECARSEQYADSIRALCLINLRSLGRRNGRELPRVKIPLEIRQLADRLSS